MTVGEFKKTEQYKHATDIYYLNMNGEEVSGLPEIILNNLDCSKLILISRIFLTFHVSLVN